MRDSFLGITPGLTAELTDMILDYEQQQKNKIGDENLKNGFGNKSNAEQDAMLDKFASEIKNIY